MKLILFLLFPVLSFSQTGKYDNNASVQIYFSEGSFEIVNMNQGACRIETLFVGDTSFANISLLEHGHRFKFKDNSKNFIVSARALERVLYTDFLTWVTVDSELLVLGNKVKAKAGLIIKKCNTSNE